jgi:hypothetical protein
VTWDGVLDALVDRVEETREGVVVAVDDAHHLAADGSAPPEALARAWTRIRARTLPVHLLLAGPEPRLEEELLDERLRRARSEALHLAPLSLRSVERVLPGLPPRDRVRAAVATGGLPARLAHLPGASALLPALASAWLEPGAPLGDDGLRRLAGDLQSPARYLALLVAMAHGARSWRELRQTAAGVDSGAEIGPYLARLESLGRVRTRRSLDAGPRSRRRRYEIADPGLTFWLRTVLPRRSASLGAPGGDDGPVSAYEAVGRELDQQVEAALPGLVRRHLLLHGEEILPARAREIGGLWGTGYEIPVAGTLRSGAVVYGLTRWSGPPMDEPLDDRLQRGIRETRYGFGREARIRLLVSVPGFTPALRRRAARDPFLLLADLDALLAPSPAR